MTAIADPEFAQRYGPWAVVAGSSDGTGAAYAEYLAARGINLMLVSRREAVLQDQGARLAGEYGISFRALAQDLSKAGAAQAMLDASADLDVGIYVSNAGVTNTAERFLDTSLADNQAAVQMNVTTLVEAVHGFGLRLRKRGRGGIVIMASETALGGRPLFTMYSSTKAFEAVFAESLWAEMRDEDIDVIGAIAPGMDTPTMRRNRGKDEALPYHQMPADVVAKTFATLGKEALVYFPLPANAAKYEAIREQRKVELDAAAAWSASYLEAVSQQSPTT